MDFICDHCGKGFTRRYTLKVHKLNKHRDAKNTKRTYEDDDDDFYKPLKRSNAVPDNWNPNEEEPESLQRSDGIPVTTVSKRNLFSHQALSLRSQPFKFKHPFCMLVAGPSHSGKTSWTVKLLAERP